MGGNNPHHNHFNSFDKLKILWIIMTNKTKAICKECHEEFTKKHNREVYCCDTCRSKARREQNRKNRRNYYHRWKNILKELPCRGTRLGTGGLGGTPAGTFKEELIKIKKEMRRLHIGGRKT